ncbi:hypothetical protein GJ699_32430 [Duganella sp. FT80W]|uniref:Uncharacterized protein n=1 Tax=Duganella guangzhouensis TaxID=2666084 RepID=A0A6I2LCY1_9BURK|nr:hypothetical protein [Duganella guangzhouensis]MRW94684.1 hypothetical protein [Duganella guangzhouensis]
MKHADRSRPVGERVTRAATNELEKKQVGVRFPDNRLAMLAQRKLKEVMHDSPLARKMTHLQDIASERNNSIGLTQLSRKDSTKKSVVQAKWIDNDGPFLIWDKMENDVQWYFIKDTGEMFYSRLGVVSEKKSREEWVDEYGSDPLKGEDATVIPLQNLITYDAEYLPPAKICTYCKIGFSLDLAQQKCEVGSADSYKKSHRFVKNPNLNMRSKSKPTTEEIEKRKAEKVRPVKNNLVDEVSSQSSTSNYGITPNKLIPLGCEYTQENTKLLVKYCKLSHLLEKQFGNRIGDTGFRKQAGVFLVKLSHFCDGLLIAIKAAISDNPEEGLFRNKDKDYIEKQLSFIKRYVSRLAKLPGTVDFQSCDSAVIDLEQQYQRALFVEQSPIREGSTDEDDF